MSIETLKKQELLELAEKYGVSVSPTDTKAEIVNTLAEEGVTDEFLTTLEEGAAVAASEPQAPPAPAAPVTSKPEINEGVVLVKYRGQTSYSGLGFKFSKEHPFNLIPEDKANNFLNRAKLFKRANAQEVEEFYA